MRVIVTTGRTEELLSADGVAITNGFTGRQGQEIARAFVAKGAEVVVVSGPTALPDVEGARTVHVTSAAGMMAAAMLELDAGAEVFVGVAAVSDFSVKSPLPVRLAPGEGYALSLEENPSIVGAAARHAKRPRAVVSFAAQSPADILEYAKRKFEKAAVDMTVANPIGGDAAVTRDPARNEVYIVTKGGVEKIAEAGKAEIAGAIVERILSLLSKTP